MYKELSPCPFCNGRAVFVGGDCPNFLYDEAGCICGVEYIHTPVYVECQNCGAVTDKFFDGTNDENFEEAEIAWNNKCITLEVPNGFQPR